MTATATAVLESMNPSTGEVVGAVPITPADEIPAIVARARAAQPAWAARSAQARADLIAGAAQTFIDRADELGALLSREQGKPLAEGVGEVTGCGSGLAEELTEIVDAIAPRSLQDDNARTTLRYDPLGVCAAITPWNFPIAMPHWLVIPALACGNTVVLKPSEETPLIAQAYHDIIAPHLPEDVFQIIHGADDQGKALVNADVNLIAFTGSRDVGAKIMAAAAPTLKRLILELGSKDPLIVLEDADIEAAAAYAARNSFRNCGQVCVSTERIYVHNAIAEKFNNALIEATKEYTVGDAFDESARVGPMIHAAQKSHVLSQINQAIASGATNLSGESDAEGNFLRPTILAGVTHDMDIMRTETFGPVACVTTVTNDEEAIALANDTPYGLGASVFGEPRHAAEIASRLTAGMVGINKNVGGAKGSPWVGAGQSGYAYHSGPDGHRQFCQVRTVSEAVS